MVFTVAVAELERSPIVERMKAGLRNAREGKAAAWTQQNQPQTLAVLPRSATVGVVSNDLP